MKNKIIIFLSLITFLVGCEDYLDVVPESDMSDLDKIFMKQETALTMFNACYKYYDHETFFGFANPAMEGSDEYVTNDFYRNKTYSTYSYIEGFKLTEGLQNPSTPIYPSWDATINYYEAINNCNIFIKNVHKVMNMSENDKKKYTAMVKAIKGVYYFKLIRKYGPIVLMENTIDIESDISDMQLPRRHVDTCFNRAVKLFDESLPYLESFTVQSPTQYGLLTKEAVLSYKAIALMYAASPLFNGNEWYADFKNRDGINLFNSKYDKEKWKRAAEAADEAVRYCESQGFFLENTHTNETTPLLNTIRNIQYASIAQNYNTNEMIYGVGSENSVDYIAKLPLYNPDILPEKRSWMVHGSINPTMRMVELFYTENGLPISEDADWDYERMHEISIENEYKYKNVIDLGKPNIKLHLKREPRFYANIAAPGCVWKKKDEYVVMKPYRNAEHGVNTALIRAMDPVNLSGYWCKKFISPEIYAWQKEDNLITYNPFPTIRLAELYLIQAECWNEYLDKPNNKVYEPLNKVRKRAGIPSVQESWSIHAKNKDKVNDTDGMREIIQQERMIELAFEGHRFWDLRRWKIAHLHLGNALRGWNILGTNENSFYENGEGPIEIWNKNRFTSPRDYFWPIRDEEILKANIVQNPGW